MKFLSDEGKQNGLYWKTSDNETPSQIGPLIVSAAGEGYALKQGQSAPFHGYYYRMLSKHGPAAKGGAKDYLVNGQLTRGFAFVAYPAEYRNSGVMTFIVNQDGIVYEKDLGQDTGAGCCHDGIQPLITRSDPLLKAPVTCLKRGVSVGEVGPGAPVRKIHSNTVQKRIMTALAHELSARGAIDVREAFIDASFAPAKKGGTRSEKRNAAREQRSWRLLK